MCFSYSSLCVQHASYFCIIHSTRWPPTTTVPPSIDQPTLLIFCFISTPVHHFCAKFCILNMIFGGFLPINMLMHILGGTAICKFPQLRERGRLRTEGGHISLTALTVIKSRHQLVHNILHGSVRPSRRGNKQNERFTAMQSTLTFTVSWEWAGFRGLQLHRSDSFCWTVDVSQYTLCKLQRKREKWFWKSGCPSRVAFAKGCYRVLDSLYGCSPFFKKKKDNANWLHHLN